jgi:hypothetical protein
VLSDERAAASPSAASRSLVRRHGRRLLQSGRFVSGRVRLAWRVVRLQRVLSDERAATAASTTDRAIVRRDGR